MIEQLEIPQRKIIHIDMDCFYAAVEIKYRPELRGKAVAVGGPAHSRSVLTTASYEARKFGLRSAMPSSQAVRLCPHLILLPPNFELYRKESQAVREIMARFSEHIEPLSLDEAYLDVTGSAHFSGHATAIAREIRRLIETELNLTASAGIAPNKFLAKIASDWKKPNGQFAIRPSEIEAFMPNLKVEKIFGVGKVTAQKMHDLGLFTCGDIQKQSLFQLARWFGSRAGELRDLSFGIDHRKVDSSSERKSLTVEETFPKDLQSVDEGIRYLPSLYSDWESRMLKTRERERIKGHTVKLKFQDFQTTTHETTSKEWPKLSDFERLLRAAWERKRLPVRLIGLGVRLADDKPSIPANQLKFEL